MSVMDQPLITESSSSTVARAPWWMRLLGAVFKSRIRIRREPINPAATLLQTLPVCYVTERYRLSDRIILEQACREADLPSPLLPFVLGDLRKPRAMFALSRRKGWLIGRSSPRTHSETLAQLFEVLRTHPELDVQLVPVSIFVGRAPDRQSGWFGVLFSENWVVVGRFRRLLALLLNGHDTIVQFSTPVSLRQVLSDEHDAPNTLRKFSRVLRAHFRRIRAAVIGPDLSHRRTLVDTVVNADPVRAVIASVASKESLTLEQAQARARSYVWEIAADYSHPVVRSLSFLLTSFWNRIYDGVRMNHFESLRTTAPGHEIIYVPCHRSHIDYLLLSYLLYQNKLVVPHIAAGINLNLPGLGSILRRGGAFFMRRSFKGNALYSVVFNEYVSQLVERGVPIEYFIEGGRSRTGRLLTPRVGMLTMTVRAFLRAPRRPVMFQPVYVGYEKLMEGNSYMGELSGKPKEKETWLGLLRSFGVLRQRYGKVVVNFGEPVFLADLLDKNAPNWRAAVAQNPDDKPEWFNAAVATLADTIQININRAADVNPINLLAIALLATRKHALAESDLLVQLELSKALLNTLPYSDRVTVTALTPAEIIAYGERMQMIQRVSHPLGDVLLCEGKNAVLLSYFRNNVLHLFTTSAWIACCFINTRRITRASILRLGKLIYPFLQAELFLPWSEDEFVARITATIEFFVVRGLLQSESEGRTLSRAAGQSDTAFQLRTIAHSLLQAFERYYITIALLVKNGPRTLSAGELENLCHLTAQRLSLLHEMNAPEFFDKSLFRSFIQQLKQRRVVWNDESGKLDFDASLEVVGRDAKLILSREIRHGILKLTDEGRSSLAIEPTTNPPPGE